MIPEGKSYYILFDDKGGMFAIPDDELKRFSIDQVLLKEVMPDVSGQKEDAFDKILQCRDQIRSESRACVRTSETIREFAGCQLRVTKDFAKCLKDATKSISVK